MDLTLVGWVGSILLGICGLPQALKCTKEGHACGLSWGFLFCWFFGELFTIFYVIPTKNYPLIFNYSFNIVLLIIMLKYKIKPRKG
jgi:uncharacterized protein with PQ loop repeat